MLCIGYFKISRRKNNSHPLTDIENAIRNFVLFDVKTG